MRTFAIRQARRGLDKILWECGRHSRLPLLIRDVSQDVSRWARKEPKHTSKQALSPNDLCYVWDRFFTPGMLQFVGPRRRRFNRETLELVRVTIEVIRDIPLLELVARHYVVRAICHQSAGRPLRFVENMGQIELHFYRTQRLDDEVIRSL